MTQEGLQLGTQNRRRRDPAVSRPQKEAKSGETPKSGNTGARRRVGPRRTKTRTLRRMALGPKEAEKGTQAAASKQKRHMELTSKQGSQPETRGAGKCQQRKREDGKRGERGGGPSRPQKNSSETSDEKALNGGAPGKAFGPRPKARAERSRGGTKRKPKRKKQEMHHTSSKCERVEKERAEMVIGLKGPKGERRAAWKDRRRARRRRAQQEDGDDSQGPKCRTERNECETPRAGQAHRAPGTK